jgi:Flp pilus assembly protein TadD
MLLLVTIALYWPATKCDFTNYDDKQYVLDNARVTGGMTWGNVWWAFGSGYVANWHPVTWLSHMLDCQLYGVQPWGHHLTNVVLHALNAMLVFVWLQGMTGARWRSLLVAGMFAMHPLHVESVAWVAERKDVLSGFFGLLALIFYGRYGRQRWRVERGEFHAQGALALGFGGGVLDYGLALVFLALGLMSKPMLVTWPLVMLLLDYWPLGRMERSALWRLVWEKMPFFVMAAAASVVTFLVQQRGGALRAVEALPLGERGANALISYCRYLGKLFWPADLAVFYPYAGSWPVVEVLLAGGLLVGITGLLIAQRRRCPYLLMGWLWYCGTLAPVSQVVQTGSHAMADRYMYIPAMGVMIAVVWGLAGLTQGRRYRQVAMSVAGCGVIVVYMLLTRRQLGYWKDSETLFRHALDVTQNNYVVHQKMGDAFNEKGQIDEAINQLQEALRLKPDNSAVRNNLGIVLAKKGRFDEAIRQFQEAIRLQPDYAGAHNNLGTAFNMTGQTDAAIYQFQEAIRLQPDYAGAHNNLGAALFTAGKTDAATRQFQEALRLKPGDAKVHYNFGVALLKQDRIADAIGQFRETIRLKPDLAGAHNNLGTALLKQGQIDAAINQFQEALRLAPNDAEAHNNLARALAMTNPPTGR